MLAVGACGPGTGAAVALAVQPAASVTVTTDVHVPGPGDPLAAPPPVPVTTVNAYESAPVPPAAVAWMLTAPVHALTTAGASDTVSSSDTTNGTHVALAVQP